MKYNGLPQGAPFLEPCNTYLDISDTKSESFHPPMTTLELPVIDILDVEEKIKISETFVITLDAVSYILTIGGDFDV
jgi:hypothetical protein